MNADNERLAGLKRELRAVIERAPPAMSIAALTVVLTETLCAAPRGTRIDGAVITAAIRAAVITQESARVVQ